MTIGDNTANSIIWVPGESTGKDYTGNSVSTPVDPDIALDAAVLASAKSYTDALHTKLTASGILP